ncbi:MAG TPA: hypothetical protein VFO61_00555, partial [Alphaproteobacteria bacterium]|nr:hypothetical protein [Alphaproteobacteria bacterium]
CHGCPVEDFMILLSALDSCGVAAPHWHSGLGTANLNHLNHLNRSTGHSWLYAGHPRVFREVPKKNVDGRNKSDHDEKKEPMVTTRGRRFRRPLFKLAACPD